MINMTDDLYCEIYVGGATKSDVQELISMLFGGSFERNTLYLMTLSLTFVGTLISRRGGGGFGFRILASAGRC